MEMKAFTVSVEHSMCFVLLLSVLFWLATAFTFITHPHYICAMSTADLMLYFAMSDRQN